ncbi:MAG: hypothetical protein HY093_03810 [Candidatus Liptonbacteria bacterium]|nr:hypothetical protein [Candidatus Liptonbacteria bacterium]
MNMKNFLKNNFDLIQTIGIVGGLIFTGCTLLIGIKTLQASNRIASANYVLQVSNVIDKPKYVGIINAIENNPGAYSILTHGFKNNDIEDYFGNFETLGDLMIDNLVDPRMAYDELGYDLEKAWCNTDVQKVIKDARIADGIPSGQNAFYIGFESLAKFSLDRDHKTCLEIDKE